MHPPQTLFDDMDPARAAALYATLGLTRSPDAPLIAFGHQIYFWQAEPPSTLGRDGHPRTGGLVPETGLPRRMWAGGRLQFHTPLILGTRTQKTTYLEQVSHKQGRSGPLAFVTLRHEISQCGALTVTEWQDLVYRDDPAPKSSAPAAPRAPENPQSEICCSFSTTTLFRYSALTFNGHRIHYDADYCREVEGYPGLVVHGPLLAQQLILMAVARLGRLSRFRFRATSALFQTERARLCARDDQFWVAGPDGRLCMTAQAD